MFRDVTPERAIAFTRFSVAMTYCWPLPSTATKFQVLCFKILRSLMFFNGFMLLGPLLYALHVHRGDTENVSKAAVGLLAVVHLLFNISLSIQYDRFQKANTFERKVFQRYVNKYSMFYGLSALWFYLTSCSMILGTFFISDPFPTNAEYPFAVDFEPVRSIIFIHQAIIGVQCAAHVCMNMFCALLLLFSVARFEILMTELSTIEDAVSLIKCIKQYHVIKRYSEEVVKAVWFIPLFAVVLGGVACVFSFITIIGEKPWLVIYDQRSSQSFNNIANFLSPITNSMETYLDIQRHPLVVKVQFCTLAGTGLLEAFMCALPADRLKEMSENVMRAVYESSWYNQTVVIQKCVSLMLLPQPPVIIRVKCIIPTLSLSYFCSFISNVFSLFTALRIVLMKDEDDQLNA